MIPFRYSPSGILTAVHPRVAALAVLSWLLVVGVAAAQPEATEPQTLSLDDLATLDALLEEDSDAAVAVLDRGAVVDLAALGLVLAFAMFSFVKKSDRLKVVSLVLSVAYLGFVKASLVSVVDIFGALHWSLPAFRDSQAYYLLVGFTLVSTVLWGRLYCGRICAFGALTQLMDRVVPARYRVEPPAWLDRRLVYVKYVLLGVAVLYFLASGDTLVYRYIEPFWMFTLERQRCHVDAAGPLAVRDGVRAQPLLSVSLLGRRRSRAPVQLDGVPHQTVGRVSDLQALREDLRVGRHRRAKDSRQRVRPL